MSSVSRAGPRGGKGAAKTTETSGSGSKTQKTDTKTDTPKPDNPKTQPTAEQMRIAQIIDTRSEDPDMKNKIKQVMDATRKSEDEVCTALHDCDNDLDRAVNMLMEGEAQGEWVTSGNKKKNRHPGATVSSTRGDKSDNNRDRSEPGESGPDRERSRTRGGGPPRMRGRGSSDSRGWRGRENKENEKNLQEEGNRDGGPPRRGGGGGRMMNGPGRSGRGGRGGRSGPRTFQSRGEKGGPGFPRSIDTWNPHGDAEPSEAPANGPEFAGENWNDDFPSPEDWDNEEYTGSLADTKVFTASANVTPQTSAGGNSGLEGRHDATAADLAAVASALPTVSNNSLENAASMLPQSLTSAGMQVAPGQQSSKSLTPAQTQYLNQLTQASLATENLKAAVGIGSSNVSSNGTKEPGSYVSAVNAGGGYQSNAASTYQTSTPAYTATTVSYAASTYGAAAASSAPSYSSQMKGTAAMMNQQQQPRPKTQRIRVPPPSKIPASAVEMPGDAANSSISFLDVQFGGLEFGSDSSSFEFPPNNTASSESANKFQSSNAGSGLESNKVGSSVGVPLDLSSMGLAKNSQQSQQQQAQVQQQASQQQQQQTQSQVSGMDGYSSASGNQSGASTGQSLASQHSQHSKDLSQQASSLSAMSHSQKMSGTDSMTFPSQVSEHKPQQASVANSYSQSRAGGGTSNTGSSGLDMVKSEPSSTPSLSYSNSSSSNTNAAYQSSYQKPSSVYQSSTNYSSSAVSQPGVYSQGNSASSTQYQTSQQSQNSGYSSAQTGYNSQATAFPSSANQPPTTSYSQTSGNPSSYHQSQSASGYQSSSYPSMSQPSSVSSSYQSNQQYQAVAQQQQQQQSYSAGVGSTSYTPATGSSAVSQYQSGYGSNGPVTTATSLHGANSGSAKLGSGMGSTTSKDSQYDVPSTATGSSLGSANVQGASSVTPSSLGLVSSAAQASTNAASTKVTSSTAGVPQAMMSQHQYIMSQQGMPFYNVQQPIYGFEDYQHQLMQSRVPMQTASGFYDLSSLAAGRESGMTSVAYSVSDGRFARTDNNSSPVPSTLSQQNPTQAHQQPMLNPTTLPPGYAYFYGTGVVPGSFQYGTPTLYQLPTATNAHGATNSTQYAKPATYSSGYGSGYDSLSGQGTADYSKASGGYATSQGGQTSKGSVVGSAGSSTSAAASASDLTSNMYGKTHVALGKVNSYDKQGFHSGTPPPFSLPASQTSQMGAAAAGYTPLFIPTLAPHQQLHQPLHQMEFRNQGRRSDSGSGTGQRSQTTSQQSKTGAKQAYNTSYWAQN